MNEWFQHTAARRRLNRLQSWAATKFGFNTQPPEGGCAAPRYLRVVVGVSTHSRPKAAVPRQGICVWLSGFQHTAARRRLIGRDLCKIPFPPTADTPTQVFVYFSPPNHS